MVLLTVVAAAAMGGRLIAEVVVAAEHQEHVRQLRWAGITAETVPMCRDFSTRFCTVTTRASDPTTTVSSPVELYCCWRRVSVRIVTLIPTRRRLRRCYYSSTSNSHDEVHDPCLHRRTASSHLTEWPNCRIATAMSEPRLYRPSSGRLFDTKIVQLHPVWVVMWDHKTCRYCCFHPKSPVRRSPW